MFLFLFPFAYVCLSVLASLLYLAFFLLPLSALCDFMSSWSFFSFSTSVKRIFFWVRVSSFAGLEAIKLRVEYTTLACLSNSLTVTGPHSRVIPAGLLAICGGCNSFTSPAAGTSSALSKSSCCDLHSLA